MKFINCLGALLVALEAAGQAAAQPATCVSKYLAGRKAEPTLGMAASGSPAAMVLLGAADGDTAFALPSGHGRSADLGERQAGQRDIDDMWRAAVSSVQG